MRSILPFEGFIIKETTVASTHARGDFMKRSFIVAGCLGVVGIIIGLGIGSFFPKSAGKMPAGFKTPVLAFEFIQTKQEVYDMFGATDTPERQAIVQAMDKGNNWDYLYMLSYCAFLAALALAIRKETGKAFFYVAAAVAVAILASDFFENRQLFQITANLASGNFEDALSRLMIITWLKWGGLALFFVLLIPYFIKGGVYAKIIAAFAVLNFIVAIIAVVHRSQWNEWMFLTLAPNFLLSIVYCFIHKAPKTSG